MGNLLSQFTPGPVVYASWSYDPNNRPVVMNVLRETDVFVTYAYDPLGRVMNRQLGAGVNSTSVYDPAGRLSVLEHLTSAAGVNAVYTGTYDPAGNRLTQAELDGTITTFAYDNSYQLVHEARSGAHPYNITYSYDPLGNRLSMVSSNVATTYSYNAANELVLTVPHTGQPTTTSYDANGNTALDNAGGALTTYLWDPENRLLSLRAPTAWTTATYSADGKRQSYASHNASGGFSALCDWRDEWLENHFIAGGSPDYFAMPGDWGPILQSQGGAPTYYLYDMLHNTRIATTLAATQTIVYTAFGPVVFDSFSGGTPLRKFQGEMGYDMDLSNLNYARNRYVDPAKARWISRDPIGYAGLDLNTYRFSANNPSNLVDPTGLASCNDLVSAYNTLSNPPNQNAICPAARVFWGEVIRILAVGLGWTYPALAMTEWLSGIGGTLTEDANWLQKFEEVHVCIRDVKAEILDQIIARQTAGCCTGDPFTLNIPDRPCPTSWHQGSNIGNFELTSVHGQQIDHFNPKTVTVTPSEGSYSVSIKFDTTDNYTFVGAHPNFPNLVAIFDCPFSGLPLTMGPTIGSTAQFPTCAQPFTPEARFEVNYNLKCPASRGRQY